MYLIVPSNSGNTVIYKGSKNVHMRVTTLSNLVNESCPNRFDFSVESFLDYDPQELTESMKRTRFSSATIFENDRMLYNNGKIIQQEMPESNGHGILLSETIKNKSKELKKKTTKGSELGTIIDQISSIAFPTVSTTCSSQK